MEITHIKDVQKQQRQVHASSCWGPW